MQFSVHIYLLGFHLLKTFHQTEECENILILKSKLGTRATFVYNQRGKWKSKLVVFQTHSQLLSHISNNLMMSLETIFTVCRVTFQGHCYRNAKKILAWKLMKLIKIFIIRCTVFFPQLSEFIIYCRRTKQILFL